MRNDLENESLVKRNGISETPLLKYILAFILFYLLKINSQRTKVCSPKMIRFHNKQRLNYANLL